MLRELLARALIAGGRRAERRGRLADARERYQRAARLAPRLTAAQINLGALLEAAGDAEGARRAYETAREAAPGDPFANYNTGRLAFWRGEVDAAERLLQRALETRPEFPDALVMLAFVLDARGRPAEAAARLEAALRLRSDAPGPWYNYGEALWKCDRGSEAEAALRRALELEPQMVPAWLLLGSVLRSDSRIEDAARVYADARRAVPGRLELDSAELLCLTLSDSLSAQALFERHRAFGERLEAAVAPRDRAWRGTREPERRLRVGFVSCDFRRHPVAWFVLPLLERFDRARIESVCYNTGAQADEVTAQVKAVADGWVEAAAIDDEALADAIEADAIDILVDLTGHTGEFRLGVFARRAAPLQASWLGYLQTTGLTRIGWRISDARADPPGASEALHTERLVRLPHALWCFRPSYAAPQAAPRLPALDRGFVTFGSFNHAPKLSATARRAWREILDACPGSRLLLVGIPAGRVRDELERQLGAERLTILPRVPIDEYLQQFELVDLALDTMPYGGGTTTFDALWMGVPVLTLAGERSAGRSAASILGALGLPGWIARSQAEYVRLALAHAADRAGLAELRATLRARLRASALMDEAGFARDMEALLRGLWREWCAQAIT